MIALDTNVIVRVLTMDDPVQARRAAKVMESGPLWLSKTILLETEWVLRFAYEFSAQQIHRALVALVGLQRLDVEDAPAVRAALGWHARGMDFADALHLASAGRATKFVTFDRKLARSAARAVGAPEVELLR